jgi:predicted alpha/beta hydrolase
VTDRADATGGQTFELRGSDGVPVVATAYRPPRPPAGGDTGAAAEPPAIVIACATGVPQTLYRGIALWLAERGHTVYTFDWRGTAASRPARLRGFDADFRHWVLDLDTLLANALAHHARVSLLGHSVGGLLGPLARQATQLHRLVLVGAQTAYWRDWPMRHRVPMLLLWHGLMPVVTLLAGYFPGRALRLGEDLPRGIAMQWARRPWQDPLVDWPVGGTAAARDLYARALPPVTMFAAIDDPFATLPAMQRVAAHLTGTAVRCEQLSPRLAGQRRLGHFDLFRRRAQALWPRLRDAAVA